MKSVSPLITSVLLIGFVAVVGIVLLGWLTGMSKEQSSEITKAGEKSVECTFANFKAPESLVKYNFSSSPYINVTIINTGKTELYNFSFLVLTTLDSYQKFYVFLPENQKTKEDPLKKGEIWTFNLLPLEDRPSPNERILKIHITAMCKEEFPVDLEINMAG